MSRQNIPQQIVDLQTLLEIAKDNWLEGKPQDAVNLLQRAKREIGLVIWRTVLLKQENNDERKLI